MKNKFPSWIELFPNEELKIRILISLVWNPRQAVSELERSTEISGIVIKATVKELEALHFLMVDKKEDDWAVTWTNTDHANYLQMIMRAWNLQELRKRGCRDFYCLKRGVADLYSLKFHKK